MRVGTCGLELEITLSFHDDGNQSGLRSIAAEGVALPDDLAKALWGYLRDLKEADVLIEACWENAEEEG